MYEIRYLCFELKADIVFKATTSHCLRDYKSRARWGFDSRKTAARGALFLKNRSIDFAKISRDASSSIKTLSPAARTRSVPQNFSQSRAFDTAVCENLRKCLSGVIGI